MIAILFRIDGDQFYRNFRSFSLSRGFLWTLTLGVMPMEPCEWCLKNVRCKVYCFRKQFIIADRIVVPSNPRNLPFKTLTLYPSISFKNVQEKTQGSCPPYWCSTSKTLYFFILELVAYLYFGSRCRCYQGIVKNTHEQYFLELGVLLMLLIYVWIRTLRLRIQALDGKNKKIRN